ncbi:phosphate ABC transporter substrate-binding protein [bacterium]|nr:phosphate ABC transporter substrate-binding protein [bacterium]
MPAAAKTWKRLPIAALLATLLLAAPASAREIRIVGSSTVFPFSTTVAEQFGANSRFATPVVEQNGSGAGLKLFCSGIGQGFPDIANSSRRMKGSEWDLCQSNNVTDIVELKIGYDGIVLANAKRSEAFDLSLREIFLGLAKEVPINGRLTPNPYQRWSDISSDLPDLPIQVFGPPPSSGTRDAFLELAMTPGARTFPELAEIEEDDVGLFTEIAHSIREDGRWTDAGENDGAIVLRLTKNPDALGVFGFAFLLQNEDRIRGAKIDGMSPTFEAIASQRYEVSRSLYIYIKKAHLAIVNGLKEFVGEFTSEKAWGDEGYLIDKGLIPLPPESRKSMSTTARAFESMTERPS